MPNAFVLILAIAAFGCKEPSKLDPDPSGANRVAKPEQPTQTQPAEHPKPTPQAESEAQAFCEKTMQKVLACFEDAAFWDVFATTYFAKYPDPSGDPKAKAAWIGMRKDDIVGLKQDNELAQNCGVMVRGNRLPTPADMRPVIAAMGKSCSDFGTAMGFMLFHKGVFHVPR